MNNVYSYVENANVIETGTHNLEAGKVLQNVEALESESSWKSSESYPIIESSVDFGYNRYIIIKIRIVSMNFNSPDILNNIFNSHKTFFVYIRLDADSATDGPGKHCFMFYHL